MVLHWACTENQLIKKEEGVAKVGVAESKTPFSKYSGSATAHALWHIFLTLSASANQIWSFA